MCVILIFNIHDVTTRLCSDDAHFATDRSNITFLNRCSAYVFPALNPFRLTFLRMRESDTTLVAMRDVYFSHPAAPTVKTVPIDVSAHARVNYFVNRRKFVVSEMFYSYLRHYMSSGVHHPAVAKHDNVQ